MGISSRSVSASVVMLALLTLSAPALTAQEAPLEPAPLEVTDPVRVYVYAEDERTDVPVDLKAAGRSSRSTRTRTYGFSREQGRDAVRALRRHLQRGDNRQRLIMVVDSEAQADMFMEVVATEILHSFTAQGAVNRDDRFPASGINERLGSRVGHARRERVIVTQLSVRNNDFTMHLLGQRRGSILLSPARMVAAAMEEWVETNYPTLLRIIYGL